MLTAILLVQLKTESSRVVCRRRSKKALLPLTPL
jgi:hypothetical protein